MTRTTRVTVNLLADAEDFLRRKVRGKHGHGSYLSALLLAEKARQEQRQVREEEGVSPRESWRQSGINVD